VGDPDRVLESVAVARGIAGRRARALYAEHVAQFDGERLEVGALAGAGCGPARDEGLDRIALDLGLAAFHGAVGYSRRLSILGEGAACPPDCAIVALIQPTSTARATG
jgi:hypothetical protein